MNRTEREAAVRRLLEQRSPQVPVGLYDEVVRRGERVLRRRAATRRAMWLVLGVAAVAFAVWVLTVRPWAEPPSQTTPPVSDW